MVLEDVSLQIGPARARPRRPERRREVDSAAPPRGTRSRTAGRSRGPPRSRSAICRRSMPFPGRRCVSALPGERGRRGQAELEPAAAAEDGVDEASDRYTWRSAASSRSGADFERARPPCARSSGSRPGSTGPGGGCRAARRRASLAAIVRALRRLLPRRADQRPRRRRARAPRGVRGGVPGRSSSCPTIARSSTGPSTRIAEIEPNAPCGNGRAAGPSTGGSRRGPRAGVRAFADAQERHRELTRSPARRTRSAIGRRRGRPARDERAPTKVRQAERALERIALPDKPFEPWELQLAPGGRAGRHRRAARPGAVVERRRSRLGPSSSISPASASW